MGNGSLTVNKGVGSTPDTLTSPQFSQASSYMAFEAQPVWWMPKTKSSISLSPIVNVRLTTIGVAGTPSDNPSFTPAGNQALSSQKAVQFQFGGVLDIHAKQFKLGKSNLRWAFGAIGRYMPQSITDTQRATRIWNLHDDLFEGHTIGARVSLYQEHKFGTASRWRPAAYIDFSSGQFENYETADVNVLNPSAVDRELAKRCLETPASCFAIAPSKERAKELFTTKNGRRTYIEGRIMLKYLYLGFDINSGSGRDDVRFIGGITVTLDKFFKAVN